MSDMPDYVHALYTSVKNTWQDAENLDELHGYTTYIWIPEETFKVDVMKLHVYAEKFRAYSKSALAGGAQTKTSTSETPNHTHQVVIGTKTSSSKAGHRHRMWAGTVAAVGDIEYKYTATNANGSAARLFKIKSDGLTDVYTYEATAAHDHTVVIGTPTSESGGGAHTHDVTIVDHTHPIDFGIYEEAIATRTLSAVLYDPDGVKLKDFGVVLTGEDSDILDLTDYFTTLNYGMYRIELTASARLRARLVFYELCKMYAQF